MHIIKIGHGIGFSPQPDMPFGKRVITEGKNGLFVKPYASIAPAHLDAEAVPPADVDHMVKVLDHVPHTVDHPINPDVLL